MLHLSSPPFAEVASDLYTPRSFEAPSPQVAAPPRPEAWVYYGADNNGAVLPFSTFMETPAFRQAKRQIERRVAECRAFAEAQFTQAEMSKIHDGFDTFLQHLESGPAFFSHDQLQLLYSLGKHSLDEFCLLLNHPTIDIHQCKRALREMAEQMKFCRGAGPAFMAALVAVRQPEGSLRGQYWAALRELFDQSLQRYVRTANERDSELWRAGMEVHVINRLRLELGLPGAEPHDRHSYGTLVTAEQVNDCAQVLLADCRPVHAALLLAAAYRSRIQALAGSELGLAAAAIDPNQAAHMDALLRASRRVAPLFDGVSIHSLLAQDAECTTFHWQRDDTLVARDLLDELVRQGLIQRPLAGTLARGCGPDGPWALRHMDQRLVYAQEYLPASGRHGVVTGARLPHVEKLEAVGIPPGRTAPHPLFDVLMDTVLRGDSTTALRNLRPCLLKTQAQAVTLFQRLGPEASLQWVTGKRFDDKALAMLLEAATVSGQSPLMEQLLRDQADRPVREILPLVDQDILRKATKLGEPGIISAWAALIAAGGPALPPERLRAMLAGSPGQPLLAAMAMQKGEQALASILTLFSGLAATRTLGPDELAAHLTLPMQDLMATGRLEILSVFGRFLEDAARHRWVLPEQLPALLEGAVAGEGCCGAVLNGNTDVISWFNQLVVRLTDQGGLGPAQAVDLLCGPRHRLPSIAACAVDAGKVEVFGHHLAGVREAAKRGWVPAERLMYVLQCPSSRAISTLAAMMLQTAGGLIGAWVQHVTRLHADALLTSEQVFNLLHGPVLKDESASAWTFPTGLALSDYQVEHGALLPIESRYCHWNTAIKHLSALGALTSEQSMRLLAGGRNGRPALLLAMKYAEAINPGGVALTCSFIRARQDDVINEEQLVQLLLGQATDGSGQSAFGVASDSIAHEYLAWLLDCVQQGQMSGAVFLSLLDSVCHLRFPSAAEREAFRSTFESKLNMAPATE